MLLAVPAAAAGQAHGLGDSSLAALAQNDTVAMPQWQQSLPRFKLPRPPRPGVAPACHSEARRAEESLMLLAVPAAATGKAHGLGDSSLAALAQNDTVGVP
jgi:hypothetical protein